MKTEHKMQSLPVPAFDPSVLDELRTTFGDQNDLIARLYDNFLVHAAQYIDMLRARTNNARTTLHTLKGSAAMMGAVRISALAARLHETWLSNGDQSSEPAIRQLEDELAMFRHALAVHFPQ